MNSQVLAVIIQTQGSTYRKTGAYMLVGVSGEYSGLLSGGCLEADLVLHASEVRETRKPKIIQYDHRSEEDLVFGMGLGCEGALKILLTPLEQQVTPGLWRIDTRSGEMKLISPSSTEKSRLEGEYFFLNILPAKKLLICGAGPDVHPVVKMALDLKMETSVWDHRPAYLEKIPNKAQVETRLVRPESLTHEDLDQSYDYILIMSHHFPSDRFYFELSLQRHQGYLGLLGPHKRRERLLREIGEVSPSPLLKLYSPVGLAIGAQTPEEIALSIFSEILKYENERKEAYSHDRENPVRKPESSDSRQWTI